MCVIDVSQKADPQSKFPGQSKYVQGSGQVCLWSATMGPKALYRAAHKGKIGQPTKEK